MPLRNHLIIIDAGPESRIEAAATKSSNANVHFTQSKKSVDPDSEAFSACDQRVEQLVQDS